MRLFTFLERNATAYELVQRVVSLNYRAFLRELRAEGFFAPGKSCLDLGCGTGFLRDHLRDTDYLGVDLNPDYIAAATRRRGRCFQVGDALAVADLPRRFDRIVCVGLLHHLDDKQVRTVVAGCRSRLEPGGELFVLDALWPEGRNAFGKALRASDNGLYVRPLAEWEKLFRTGLDVKAIRAFRHWPFEYVFVRAS